MPRGGFRPGAGRPKGAKSVAKQVLAVERVLVAAPEAAKTAPVSGKRYATALEFAMDVICDTEQPLDARVRLAIAAMPFQHPKLEATGAGKKEERQKKAEAAATGRFAPAAPPKLVVNND